MAKSTFKAGQTVEFTGYTQLDEGQEELLVVGNRYEIRSINEDGSIVVVGSTGEGDTVFADEIAAVDTKRKAAPKAKATKAKATTKAKAAKPKAKAATKKTTAKKAPKAKAEPTPEPITPVMPTVEAFSDSPAVEKLLEQQDMLSAAKTLAVAAEETFLSLGGVLSHIYDTGAHKTLGFDGKRGFSDYMLNELNIQYRKGMYLIEIYKTARKLNLDEAVLAQIGWSKMKEITAKLDESNKDELLEFAREHTREELVEHIRTTMVKAGDEPVERVKKTKLTFSLFGDQYEPVQSALAAASAQIDNATPERALTMIAVEWAQLTENVEVPVEQVVSALIDRYGIDAIQAALSQVETQRASRENAELIDA